MQNHELIVKQEVSFNIILGAPEELPGNGDGRDPFDNESLTNPRQWVHMDAKVHENTLLVLGFFNGKKEANGDYKIDEVSFSVLTVDASSPDPSKTRFYDICHGSFNYEESYGKDYKVGEDDMTVNMKRISFEFYDDNPHTDKKYSRFKIKEDTPFIVRNGELIDFHVTPKSVNNKEMNIKPEKIVTVNGHICQGKFYIHP